MGNVIFVIVACICIGVLISIILGLFRKVGLNSIPDLALRMIFYNQNAYFNNDVVWNKLWLRFGVLAFAMMFSGLLLSLILRPITPRFLIHSSWLDLTIVVTMFYGHWIKIGRPMPFTLGKEHVAEENSTGFFFITQNGIIRLYNIFRGIFICAGPGSGKSKSIIEPIIQQAATANFTGILYDRKFPTLANEVAGSFQESTVSTYYVNFTDLTRSHRVNPVSPKLLTNASYAREAALTTIGNLDYKSSQKRDIWIQTAEALLTGSIWYLRNNYPQYCTLPHASSLIIETQPKTLLNLLNKDEEVRGLVAAITSSQDSEKTLASIFTTVQSYLSVLNTPEIFWVMSGDDVPFDLNSADKPSFLVVGNDADLPNTYSPLISLIIATATKRMNKPNRLPSIVILDEAPTLFIPNFQELPATARASKIATVYAVQDISQMEGQLGLQQSEMLLGNLSNQFYGRSTNPKTLQRITTLFGKHDVEYQSTSSGVSSSDRSTSNSQSVSTSVQQRDRLPMQTIRDLQTGQFVGFIAEGNTPEFVTQFEAPQSKAIEIKPFTTLSADDMKINFRRIKEEVRSIFSKGSESDGISSPPNSPKTPPPSISPDNWETFS